MLPDKGNAHTSALALAGKKALGVPVSRQLLAGFLTTGAQWDVVQVVGWVRMAVQSANAGASWELALAETFSGELCEICEAVDEARQAQHTPANGSATPNASKLLLAVYPAGDTLKLFEMPAADPVGQWSLSDQVGSSAERGAPPAPPPRSQGLV